MLNADSRNKFSKGNSGFCRIGENRNSRIVNRDVVRIEAHVLGIDTGLSYGVICAVSRKRRDEGFKKAWKKRCSCLRSAFGLRGLSTSSRASDPRFVIVS